MKKYFWTIGLILAVSAITATLILLYDKHKNGTSSQYQNRSEQNAGGGSTQVQRRTYSDWRDCVNVRVDRGSGQVRIYAKNICDTKIKRVDVEYLVSGYGRNEVRSTSFYGLRPNQTDSSLLGITDSKVRITISNVNVIF